MTAARLPRRYRIGPQLQQAWRDRYGDEITSGLEFPPGTAERMWADFRLSANRRGLEMAIAAAHHFSRGRPTLAGLRTIDVGCGLGGVPVACSVLGAEAWGIDVDDDLVALAQANARDQRNPPRIEWGDLLDPALAARLGWFDAVTAEDILEHVADAAAGAAALAGLARAGGVVVTTVPNGDAVAHVRADPHYALPGLTLLADRSDAAAYHATRGGAERYDVGDYHGYDAYIGWLRDAGLEVRLVEHIGETDPGRLDADLAAAAAEVEAAADRLPSRLRAALLAGWQDYAARVDHARRLPALEARRRLTVLAWRFHATRGERHRSWSWRGPSVPPSYQLRLAAKQVPGARRAAAWIRRRAGR